MNRLEEEWPRTDGAKNAAIVLSLGGAPMVPSATFLKALDAIAVKLRAQGVQLVVSGVPGRFVRLLRRTGRLQHLEDDDIVAATPKLHEALDIAYARAEKLIVGVNAFQVENEPPVETLYIPDELADQQVAGLDAVRSGRDGGAVARTLDALKRGASADANTMPLMLDCVRAYCTVGEISDALRDVFGTYEEPAVF